MQCMEVGEARRLCEQMQFIDAEARRSEWENPVTSAVRKQPDSMESLPPGRFHLCKDAQPSKTAPSKPQVLKFHELVGRFTLQPQQEALKS